MRIALLSFNFPEYCIRLASALSKHAKVLLLLPRKHAEGYASLLDPSVRFLPFAYPRLRRPLKQVKMAVHLCHQIQDFHPDIFHIQHGHLWFNLFLAMLPRCGFVLTVHDYRAHPGDKPSRKTPQWILDRGIHRADELIVHARHVQELMVRNYTILADRIHVIPHIQLGNHHLQANSTVIGPPTVLFFGRIWKYKGLEYLIRAEPLITAQIPNVRIVIAGEGENFSHYRQMMVHPERFVVFNEYISDAQRSELFARATVVTLPYIEASQSGVVPVAYSHAKPVVVSNIGGLPEMVDDGQTGLCVPPADEKALAQAIVRLLKDGDLASRLGANGHRKVNTDCSPAQVADKTLQVYERALPVPFSVSQSHLSDHGPDFTAGH